MKNTKNNHYNTLQEEIINAQQKKKKRIIKKHSRSIFDLQKIIKEKKDEQNTA